MKPVRLLPLVFLFTHCAAPAPVSREESGNPSKAKPGTPHGLPQVINVSSYDPKERHRSGRSYSQHDVSALGVNGARGLIARAGKGGNLDTKCASFLAAADRAGLHLGIYYRVQRHVDAVAQADQFVSRAESLARSRSWKAPSLLLCGDYDGDLRMSDILRFMDRVEARTGVVPVAYLENSTSLKQTISGGDSRSRAKMARAPYWLALYSHESGAGPVYPAPGNPRGLLDQYRLWRQWTLWQYGGVGWENGRSRPKVYNHGRYRFTPYFGDMDRPLERNVFNGSQAQLDAFWQRHGMPLR